MGILLEKLGRVGIDSIDQALLSVPRGFHDYSDVTALRDAIPRAGVAATPKLFSLICSTPAEFVAEPKKRLLVSATDGVQTVRLVIFFEKGLDATFWKTLRVGVRFHVFGSLQSWGGQLQITGPDLVYENQVGKVIPYYRGKSGVISADTIQKGVALALPRIESAVHHLIAHFDGLSEQEIIRYAKIAVPGLRTLLHSLHRPSTVEEGEAAVIAARRLAAFGVVWTARTQKRMREPCEVSQIPVTIEDVKALVAKLSITLTNDQKRAIRDIIIDLADPYPMRRVLSGEVGSGKTYAYMIPALAAQAKGALVCILTPNALLVDQFVTDCKKDFGDDARVIGITGTSRKAIDVSENPILVGTTALLDRLAKQGVKPRFLVVDEQQKFSVEQRQALAMPETNVLEATATAIPRTIGLVTHGGMEISIIRECPVRKLIKSRIVTREERRRLADHTKKIIEAGGQVAVVYPVVDERIKDRRNVILAYERWEKDFPGRVGLIYGGMKEAEKIEVIRRLKAGELSICVTTIVIELGVTLPSLKSVVVMHAERYGVTQLHQLRGRAARHGGTGHFFMYLPESVGDETMARLRLVEETNDGFELAERDAARRGFGDLTENSDKQHGGSASMIFFGLVLKPDDIFQFADFDVVAAAPAAATEPVASAT